MSQVTVMSVVTLAQAGNFTEAARLIYNQPIAVACDLVAKSADLLSKEEWKALQKTLHVPASVTTIAPATDRRTHAHWLEQHKVQA